MRLYRHRLGACLSFDNQWFNYPEAPWTALINRPNLRAQLQADLNRNWKQMEDMPTFKWLAPITDQEVWAAGVTYLRSKVARMEEAEAAGGGDFYDRVYDAERPEIFFKATAARTVGPDDQVFIRQDSTWNVPEPELTLFCSAGGSIEAYTIGNDMSSRSIEGENPLYLPQAKSYDRSAALGPCLYIPSQPITLDTIIRMTIHRGQHKLYDESVAIRQMKRSLPELAHYLFRATSFPNGCFLMTGTCLVPGDDFTLEVGDEIDIHIENIGHLRNTVAVRSITDNPY